MIDLAKEIWQTMRTNKLRTFLTGFSVAWGIFMLILLLALANGVVKVGQQALEANEPMRLTGYLGTATIPWKGLKEGRQIQTHERTFGSIANTDPEHIEKVSTSKNLAGIVSRGENYLSGSSVVGVYPAYFTPRFRLVSGRMINEADMNGQRKSVVLEKKNAMLLFRDSVNCIGKRLKIGDASFTVVGVYDHRSQNNTLVPYSTAQALTGYDDASTRIEIKLQNLTTAEESEQVADKVKNKLSDLEKFDPSDNGAWWLQNYFKDYLNSLTANSILTYAMWIIGILTLLTGIVGVSNIMFVSVRERTHEIGIRRAIGAKPRTILMQVVLESVALTTCFGYIGIVMGTFAAELIKQAFANTEYSMIQPQVDLAIAFEVTIALIIAGALAGLFPATRATKVNPVEALRDE